MLYRGNVKKEDSNPKPRAKNPELGQRRRQIEDIAETKRLNELINYL
jgi:hypothetical protein